MSEEVNNPPAFPHLGLYPGADGNLHPHPTQYEGLSMRDYFAAKALQGLLASFECGPDFTTQQEAYEHYAQLSYAYADAMLNERERLKSQEPATKEGK